MLQDIREKKFLKLKVVFTSLPMPAHLIPSKDLDFSGLSNAICDTILIFKGICFKQMFVIKKITGKALWDQSFCNFRKCSS